MVGVIIGLIGASIAYTVLPNIRKAERQARGNALRTVAVLPFVNASGDPANEYSPDGMTEEILNSLARSPNLRIAARTSSFQFKGRTTDIKEIAEKLGVAAIVEGSVRRNGTRLRVSAELIQASDGYQIWSESYDRQLTDVFAVQDELAHAIAHALSVRLGAGSSHTPPVEAYDQYLRGRYAFATEQGGTRSESGLLPEGG